MPSSARRQPEAAGQSRGTFTLFLLLALAGSGPPRGRAQSRTDVPRLPQTEHVQTKVYLGGQTCYACHDIRKAFEKNPHYKNWDAEELPWSERGCEACHGPGFDHVDSNGDPDKIFNYKKVTAQVSSEACLTCHQRAEERINFLRSEHGLNTVACTECHTIHSVPARQALLVASSPALCYDCHGEIRAEFNLPFHHKVHEGWMDCTDCHNQHGGFNLRMTWESAGTDLVCYRCHADKQGPFVYEHLPVKTEGCGVCHEVHGSANPRLLRRAEIRFLCLECHAGSPGALGPTTPTFHDITQSRWRHCNDCHVNIHGSHVSPFFLE